MALDAVFNMQKHYNIDPNRVYVSGVSGGGRASSSTAFHHSDVYAGGIFIIGANFWRNLKVPGKSGKVWKAGYLKPQQFFLRRAKRKGRYVLLTGEKDSDREQMHLFYNEGYKKYLNHVMYIEVPGMEHTIPPPEWFEQAIEFLDRP